MTPRITVVGSLNMDMVTVTDVPPRRGETVLGQQFTLVPGGKGANQAVAAARLGADVTIIGCVGDDHFGAQVIQNLQQEQVDTRLVRTITGATTGVAQITVTKSDNSIIAVPGANGMLTPEDIQNAEDQIKLSDIVLLQLEVPMETVTAAAKIAKNAGVKVILNPAPYHPLPPELLEAADYITPNEHECDHMLKRGIGKDAARKIIVT